MRRILITVVFTLCALMPTYTFAASVAETAKCPVSGEDVTIKGAKCVYKYKGKKYYFCMKSCEDKFKKDPGKYIKKMGK